LNSERVGVNGADVAAKDRDLSGIRTRIGTVFASWPHLTVLQNPMEAPVQVRKLPKAEVYVRRRAEMDLAVAFSACPQDIVPMNGKAGKLVEAHFTSAAEHFEVGEMA
jgi:ABC-type histidine transport system ATPase subunit